MRLDRSILLALAIAPVIGAAITAATVGSATRAAGDDTCRRTIWPAIPEACLVGSAGDVTRTIHLDRRPSPETAAQARRFATAFGT